MHRLASHALMDRYMLVEAVELGHYMRIHCMIGRLGIHQLYIQRPSKRLKHQESISPSCSEHYLIN